MPSSLQALCARGECRQCGLQVQHRVAIANDPRSQPAAQLNNKSYDGTSFETLHLFLKIKVLRRPVEATADSVITHKGRELDVRCAVHQGLL
jgi:hypothetical protein